MRALVFVVLLGACGSGASSPCGDADTLVRNAHGSASDRADYAILSAHCASDHWPDAVAGCVRAATSDEAMEACLKPLPPEQKHELQQAMRAAAQPSHDLERGLTAEAERKMLADFFASVPADVFAAPECAAYRSTATTRFATRTACGGEQDQLMIFGVDQTIHAQVKTVQLALPEARAAACTKATAELEASPDLRCP